MSASGPLAPAVAAPAIHPASRRVQPGVVGARRHGAAQIGVVATLIAAVLDDRRAGGRAAGRAAQQDLRADGSPAAAAIFNHPADIPWGRSSRPANVLIVDANMGAIGTDNSKACMPFILRMLKAQLQRQVHLPVSECPRVPLLVDEAHHILAAESVIDQFATHRAAGLEPAAGVQYLAQLGSGSEHQEKILKGVLNLLQSRFLFRLGDAQDAEQVSRIAMAVYATMIRDDPDSRARLRVTPEQLLNFPNYFCLGSWIANGNRAPAFTGETFPLPDLGDGWADYQLAAQTERIGPYSEQLAATLDTGTAEPLDGEANPVDAVTSSRRDYVLVPYEEKDIAKRLGARWDSGAERWYILAGRDPKPFARWRVPAPKAEPAKNPSQANSNLSRRRD